MTKKIGIVTGTRAEYGLLYRTIKILQESESVDTRVFVCGTHLSPEYGMTIDELMQDNVENIVRVEMLMSTNSRVGVAKSVGIATMSFADAFSREELDCLLVLGDRYEILAAAQTALILDVPIAHIHGGEVTEGAFDEAIRHSITKMANIHFPVAEEFARRILQLGEPSSHIFVVGSPGIDNIVNEPRMGLCELQESLGFSINPPLALVTYHPVTKASGKQENDIKPLIQSIKDNPDVLYVITYPNADGGGKDIIEQWSQISDSSNVKIVPSLGFKRYLSIMEHVAFVIGNSSSGIIEAPTFDVTTINIGSRQKGRPRAASIIDVDMEHKQINDAIKKCQANYLKPSVTVTDNPYGQGDAAQKIASLLVELNFSDFKNKSFEDISFAE